LESESDETKCPEKQDTHKRSAEHLVLIQEVEVLDAKTKSEGFESNASVRMKVTHQPDLTCSFICRQSDDREKVIEVKKDDLIDALIAIHKKRLNERRGSDAS
jgi:hypothetical protein